jgi:glycosyltransferase involved in cell wall biosynthesis
MPQPSSRPAHAPEVSVVIPVRNEGGRVAAALRSIIDGRSEDFPIEIVIIDDDSSDGCCGGLEAIYSLGSVNLRVVSLPQWSGIPFARNAGASVAIAPILFITDANVLFPPDWDVPIRKHLTANRVLCATIADSTSSFLAYGCTLLVPSMGVGWLPHPRVFGGHVPISPCTGTVLSTALFRRVGGYDTAMPIYGAAEPEFSVRLWLAGAEIVAAPDLVLTHRFRPAPERQPFLDQISLVQLRNYLRFGMLYLDQPRIEQMCAYYAHQMPEQFPEAMRQLSTAEIWRRRRVIEERLPLRFASFVERFNLRDGAGQRLAS